METLVENKTSEETEERLVGVRFKPCGRVYAYLMGEEDLNPGDPVVVESLFGVTIGTVVGYIEDRDEAPKELKQVIRKATEDDFRQSEENKSLGEEARLFCLERIMARGLPMKLVGTEVTLDRKRIIFYFTADGRIDFRELVKDLASKFRTRIEMRQIGVRDEAKLLGGIGICGRTLCCNTFLVNFAPISIKMAKEQELVLNTTKLSGVCGRLMCCLGYEYGEEDVEKVAGLREEVLSEKEGGCLCEECEGMTVGQVEAGEAPEVPIPSEVEAGIPGEIPPSTEAEKPESASSEEGKQEDVTKRGRKRRRRRRRKRRDRGEKSETPSGEASGDGGDQKKPLKTRKGHSGHKKRKKKRR
jgi:cell fate regulator YaaT (PSP1 superfamily)